MSVVAGDIQEITYEHPDYGSGVIYPKAGEEATYDPGGFRTNDDDASIDNGGRSIDVMNRTRPFFQVPVSHDINGTREMQALADMAGSPKQGTWTIQHANGDVRRLVGKPVGNIQGNVGAGTIDLKVAGSKKMEKIN